MCSPGSSKLLSRLGNLFAELALIFPFPSSRSYVPIKVDYSDLYDTMTFFRGGPDGKHGHDDLGKKIGSAGKAWARDHVRAISSACPSIPRLTFSFCSSTVAQARHGRLHVYVSLALPRAPSRADSSLALNSLTSYLQQSASPSNGLVSSIAATTTANPSTSSTGLDRLLARHPPSSLSKALLTTIRTSSAYDHLMTSSLNYSPLPSTPHRT